MATQIKRYKVSNNFYLDELFPKKMYLQFANIREGKRLKEFLDPSVVNILQFLRDRFGQPITVNNWLQGGIYQNSGFRWPWSRVGAWTSTHRRGLAADPKFLRITPEEVREDIRNNFELYAALGLTTIEELTPTWLHFDTRPTYKTTLYEVPFITNK